MARKVAIYPTLQPVGVETMCAKMPLALPVTTSASPVSVCPVADRLTEAQWRLLRTRLEELAEHQASRDVRHTEMTRAEMGELLLLLVDKIDDLQRRIDAA